MSSLNTNQLVLRALGLDTLRNVVSADIQLRIGVPPRVIATCLLPKGDTPTFEQQFELHPTPCSKANQAFDLDAMCKAALQRLYAEITASTNRHIAEMGPRYTLRFRADGTIKGFGLAGAA